MGTKILYLRKSLIVLLVLVGSISGHAQPKILINPDTVDFGTVEYQSAQSRFAYIHNIGNKPLLLTNVISSCGCTVPTWTRDSIYPGDSSKIEIEYNTYIIGRFSKSVSVYSNDPARSLAIIRIIGEVVQSTGIRQIEVEDLVLFPNPASSYVNISGLIKPAEVKIFTIHGQLLKSYHNVQNQIDISDLDQGIYIFSLMVGEAMIIRKVIKEFLL